MQLAVVSLLMTSFTDEFKAVLLGCVAEQYRVMTGIQDGRLHGDAAGGEMRFTGARPPGGAPPTVSRPGEATCSTMMTMMMMMTTSILALSRRRCGVHTGRRWQRRRRNAGPRWYVSTLAMQELLSRLHCSITCLLLKLLPGCTAQSRSSVTPGMADVRSCCTPLLGRVKA